MTLFVLKFVILVLAQMALITNRIFLSLQCHSVDFLVRIGLQMDQWFNAYVAVERALSAFKGATFPRKKSKQAAKFVIVLLIILIAGSSIHDPLFRQLIDEDNIQKRIWCIVKYPSGVDTYNYIVQIVHFFWSISHQFHVSCHTHHQTIRTTSQSSSRTIPQGTFSRTMSTT